MMDSTQQLLDEIDAFLERSGTAETTFGMKVLNDRGFVSNLRKGRTTTLKTADKVRAYIAEHSAPQAVDG